MTENEWFDLEDDIRLLCSRLDTRDHKGWNTLKNLILIATANINFLIVESGMTNEKIQQIQNSLRELDRALGIWPYCFEGMEYEE